MFYKEVDKRNRDAMTVMPRKSGYLTGPTYPGQGRN